jgi:hypothetical protein
MVGWFLRVWLSMMPIDKAFKLWNSVRFSLIDTDGGHSQSLVCDVHETVVWRSPS